MGAASVDPTIVAGSAPVFEKTEPVVEERVESKVEGTPVLIRRHQHPSFRMINERGKKLMP